MKFKFNFRVYKKTLRKWATPIIYSRIERKNVPKDVCSFGFITCTSNLNGVSRN